MAATFHSAIYRSGPHVVSWMRRPLSDRMRSPCGREHYHMRREIWLATQRPMADGPALRNDRWFALVDAETVRDWCTAFATTTKEGGGRLLWIKHVTARGWRAPVERRPQERNSDFLSNDGARLSPSIRLAWLQRRSVDPALPAECDQADRTLRGTALPSIRFS